MLVAHRCPFFLCFQRSIRSGQLDADRNDRLALPPCLTLLFSIYRHHFRLQLHPFLFCFFKHWQHCFSHLFGLWLVCIWTESATVQLRSSFGLFSELVQRNLLRRMPSSLCRSSRSHTRELRFTGRDLAKLQEQVFELSSSSGWIQPLVLLPTGLTAQSTPAITSLDWAPACGRSYQLIAAGYKDGLVRLFRLQPPSKPISRTTSPNLSETDTWSYEQIAELKEHAGTVGGVSKVRLVLAV